MTIATTDRWPPIYRQPDPKRDCHFYTVAYLCHCLGHPEVTADAVRHFREERGLVETHYLEDVIGATVAGYWRDKDEQGNTPDRWWLGQDTRAWVEGWLRDGWAGLAMIHRTPEMHHAVALLEDRGGDGVLLMDPHKGPVVEPWDWFLGIGAHKHGCHRIEAWVKLP